jgi:hypothetical protein
MTNYGERTGTGGPGSGVITNDDDYLLDIPEEVSIEELKEQDKLSDRSY